jgi:hypothetical protein
MLNVQHDKYSLLGQFLAKHREQNAYQSLQISNKLMKTKKIICLPEFPTALSAAGKAVFRAFCL